MSTASNTVASSTASSAVASSTAASSSASPTSTAARHPSPEAHDTMITATSPFNASVTHQVHPGTSVEVLSSFSGRWVPGFDVVEVAEQGYRLRRRSDHAVLPVWFGPDEVRIVGS